jgi:hypothetical protein
MNYSPEVMANMGKWVESQSYMLEQEMIEAKAKEMQQEMDREILWGMLEAMDWTRVMLPYYTSNEQAIDIQCWIEENCKHAHERSGRDFIFEDSKDANWFKLRWGSI